MFSFEISKTLKNTYFEEHLRTTADQMICNIIRKNKSGVLHFNQICFKCEKDRVEKDTISAGPK